MRAENPNQFTTAKRRANFKELRSFEVRGVWVVTLAAIEPTGWDGKGATYAHVVGRGNDLESARADAWRQLEEG